MSNYYDDDDYTLSDLSPDFSDDFTLTDEELDQYQDAQHVKLEELEYGMWNLEEFISRARLNGSDDLERLEDELEILTVEYLRYIEQGE